MSELRVFIGSSSERLPEAAAVHSLLRQNGLAAQRWDIGSIFELGDSTLESLIAEAHRADAAVFVFAPDDVARIRKKQKKTVRDNVLFEHGLFVGQLGRGRSFIIIPSGANVHLPSDLLGITCATYRPPSSDLDLEQSLAPACDEISRKIKLAGSFQTAIVNDCCIRISVGNLLSKHSEQTVIVYPVNEYFDTTPEESIVDWGRSTWGQYLANRVKKRNLKTFDTSLDKSLVKLNKGRKQTERKFRKPGRQQIYPIGTALPFKNKNDDLLLLVTGHVTPALTATTDTRTLQQSLSGLWKWVESTGNQQRIAVPVFGSGFGGLPQPEALAHLLLSFKSTALKSRSRLCGEVEVLIYHKEGKLPSWVRSLFLGLFKDYSL